MRPQTPKRKRSQSWFVGSFRRTISTRSPTGWAFPLLPACGQKLLKSILRDSHEQPDLSSAFDRRDSKSSIRLEEPLDTLPLSFHAFHHELDWVTFVSRLRRSQFLVGIPSCTLFHASEPRFGSPGRLLPCPRTKECTVTSTPAIGSARATDICGVTPELPIDSELLLTFSLQC